MSNYEFTGVITVTSINMAFLTGFIGYSLAQGDLKYLYYTSIDFRTLGVFIVAIMMSFIVAYFIMK